MHAPYPQRGPTHQRIRRAISVSREKGCLIFDFHTCFANEIGLSVRRRTSIRAVTTILKRAGKVRWAPELDQLILHLIPTADDLEALFEGVTELLASIASSPLTPRVLLTILPITNRERVRWTKDGRLRQSGSALIKRGQLVAVPTYAVKDVERLLARPSIISSSFIFRNGAA